jgi:hypothetical protein
LKKFIAISFIITLLLSQTGYYFFYSCQQNNIRQEVQEHLQAGLPESSLEIIANNPNINWEENGKEFILDGELYDVVHTTNSCGKIFYYCLSDIKEKQLLKDLSKCLSQANENNTGGNGARHIIKFQVSDFTVPAIANPVTANNNMESRHMPYTEALPYLSLEVPTPPPGV